VAIALSPRGVEAWMRAGRTEIKCGKIAKTARYYGMELHFVDTRGEIDKFFIISLYMPQSKYSTEIYKATLDKLKHDLELTALKTQHWS
jgi:hypothetical protein